MKPDLYRRHYLINHCKNKHFFLQTTKLWQLIQRTIYRVEYFTLQNIAKFWTGNIISKI